MGACSNHIMESGHRIQSNALLATLYSAYACLDHHLWWQHCYGSAWIDWRETSMFSEWIWFEFLQEEIQNTQYTRIHLGLLWLEQFVGPAPLQITGIDCIVRTCQTSVILWIFNNLVVPKHHEVNATNYSINTLIK